MFEYIAHPDNGWVWSLGQTVLVVFGFYFVWRQLKLARAQNSISHLNFFRETWSSRELLRARLATVRNRDDSFRDLTGYEEVLTAFLEDLAVASKIGQINNQHLWSYYSYHIEGYWHILKPKIMFYRDKAGDTSFYEDFEALYADMIKISSIHHAQPMTEEYLDTFREEEMSSVKFLLEE